MKPRKFVQSSFPTVPRCRTYFSANKIGGCTNPYTSDHNVDNLAKNTQSENKYIEIVIMGCFGDLVLYQFLYCQSLILYSWQSVRSGHCQKKFWKSIILLFPSVLQQTSINSTMAVYPAQLQIWQITSWFVWHLDQINVWDWNIRKVHTIHPPTHLLSHCAHQHSLPVTQCNWWTTLDCFRLLSIGQMSNWCQMSVKSVQI